MSMTIRKDLTGSRYGRLTVLSHEKTPGSKTFWRCRCDCGNEVIVGYGELRYGNTKSCGCLRKEVASLNGKTNSTKHGMFGTRLYHIWDSMKARCYNEKHMAYKNYGGRGISICDEWRNSFEAFHTWALENGYSDELTIDRIDVNGNYEPSNCHWITANQQANNKRNTVYITISGVTKSAAQWAREIGVSRSAIYSRIKYGWPESRLLAPTGSRNREA